MSLAEAKKRLDIYLKTMTDKGGSDIHFKAKSPAFVRVDGRLFPLDSRVLDPEMIKQMAYSIMHEGQRREYEETNECDMAYSLSGQSRFRVNVYRQRGYTGIVFRTIPLEIRSLKEMGLPPVFAKLATRPKGLILVTGPTGCGKSTTLAAMIDHINETRSEHIITIEDPIEFLHADKKCSISQREVGQDTKSFSRALRSALREDPDVILVGEMRDLETIAMAITAAETGHLVLATLHTTGAAATIDRIIDVFPPYQQQQISTQLSVTIQGVVSQTLLPRADGQGRIMAHEAMMITSGIASLIRENKVFMIQQAVQSGRELDMHTLDQHLADLFRKRIIKYEDAIVKCQSPVEFKKFCGK
ncbi:MAG: type IV pilus twitching motility protein PilT [bacterium]